MLSSFVGEVDVNAALVLVSAIVCLCVVVTSLIVKRRSRQDISNEYALAKMRQDSESHRAFYAAETERQYRLKKLDQNLITSHRDDSEGE